MAFGECATTRRVVHSARCGQVDGCHAKPALLHSTVVTDAINPDRAVSGHVDAVISTRGSTRRSRITRRATDPKSNIYRPFEGRSFRVRAPATIRNVDFISLNCRFPIKSVRLPYRPTGGSYPFAEERSLRCPLARRAASPIFVLDSIPASARLACTPQVSTPPTEPRLFHRPTRLRAPTSPLRS